MLQIVKGGGKVEDFEFILFDRMEMIKTTIQKYGEENFYVAFSGGKDSTVLHYLLDLALPDNKIPRVYVNTGIEYKDIIMYVKEMQKSDDRIKIIAPTKPIRKTLEEYGYPFKSKEHAIKLSIYQKRGCTKAVDKYLHAKKDDGTPSRFACPIILKYQFSEHFDMKISDQCCYKLKKEPSHRYEKESGKTIAILGLRMAEGGQRANRKGCVVFDSKGDKLKKFKPLNPVTDEWMDWFVYRQGIRLCKLYYPPYDFKRTGCKGCPFSLDLQEQLEIMDAYMPSERRQCEIIWKPVYDEYRRLGYRLKDEEQMRLL